MKLLQNRLKTRNLFTFLFVVFALQAMAVKKYVTNTNDSGLGSLRDVAQGASAGDTIIIDVSGTLMLQTQISINTDLTILGPGPVHFKVDLSNVPGGGNGGVAVGGAANVYVEGIGFVNSLGAHAITSGSGFSGLVKMYGCLFENNGNTVINVDAGNYGVDNCSFINNTSPNEAGAILFSGGALKIVNSTFYSNSAAFNGGAINVFGSNVELTNNTFFENGISVALGKAIYVAGGNIKVRNNIIFNDTPSTALIEIAGGTLTSQGGNITNDMTTAGMPSGSDIQAVTVSPGISAAAMIEDGWGLIYFPPAVGSDGIDIDVNPSGLPLYDQRRVWRAMDGGSGNAYADAGAVEYSQLTVTTAAAFGPGSFSDLSTGTYFSVMGKAAFVFEITGTGPHYITPGSGPFSIAMDSTIVNGFSQNGSRVPGPGSAPGTATNAITNIVINKGVGNSYGGFDVSGGACILAGVSVTGFSGASNFGVNLSGPSFDPPVIVGCHIGVNETGMIEDGNGAGVVIGEFYSGNVGAHNYAGAVYHNNRNVISGNQCQIRVKSTQEIKISRNFIGLNAFGLDRPTTASAISSDTGISVISFSTSMGTTIGGADFTDMNVIGDQWVGVYLASASNKVFNNLVGTDFSGVNLGTNTPNNTGIVLMGSDASYNIIGDINRGNVVSGNLSDGIVLSGSTNGNKVFSNFVGLGKDGSTPLGNGYTGIIVTGVGAANNEIGAVGRGNVISANNNGISLINDSGYSIVRSNVIGLTADMSTVQGNAGAGVHIAFGSAYNLIGGCAPNQGNIIGGSLDGIMFQGGGADHDSIFGNYIGTDPLNNDFGNSHAGIYLFDMVADIQIGSVGSGCGNVIAYNGTGVIADQYSEEILISGNSFHDNDGIGIDLDEDGQNGALGDGAPTANNSAQTPEIVSAINCSGSALLEINIELNGDAVIEVFKASDGEEGDSLIWQQQLTFASGSTQMINLGTVASGTPIVVTATYFDGTDYSHTSEFSVADTIVDILPLTGSSSHAQICAGGNTYPQLTTTGFVGTPIWFSDAGLTMRIDTGGTVSLPEDDIFINGPGTFNYYVVDSVAGCYGTVSAPVVVDIIAAPGISISGRDTICAFGDSTTLNVTNVSGGSYYWYTYEGNFSISGSTTSSATFQLQAEPSSFYDTIIAEVDSLGCVMRDTMVIYAIQAPYVSEDSIVQPSQCGVGGEVYFKTYVPNTSFTIYYNSGTAYTATTLSSSEGLFPFTGLAAGVYIVDSISNGMCTDYLYATNTYTIVDPAPPTVSAGADVTICEGDLATLVGTASGGGPFSYSWDNGGGTSSSAVVSPTVTTNYALSVTDNTTLCLASDTVKVTVNPLPVVNAGSDMTICEDNGLVNLASVGTPTGGIWSGTGISGSDFDPFSSGPGTFTLTYSLTDVNGCSATDDMMMTVNPMPSVGNPLVVDVTCFGGSDGGITLAPVGAYTYSWTGPSGFTAATQNISSLQAGTYSLSFSDVNGCTGSYSGIVYEPTSLPSFSATSVDLICNGDGSGQITITPGSGGWPGPYQYSIDNGGTYQSTTNYTGLSAVSYILLMTDANGCVSEDTTITLTEPMGINMLYTPYNDTCGLSKGAIDFTGTSGGAGGFSYSIDGGISSSASVLFSGLTSGSYALQVTDQNGCFVSGSAVLSDETGVTVALDNYSTQVTCFDAQDGFVDVLVNNPLGGTVIYDWTRNTAPYATTQNINALSGGNYELIATDVGGCKDTVSVVINTPSQVFGYAMVTDETCSGYADGQLDTTSVYGGTAPYSVSWVSLPSNTVIGTSGAVSGLSTGDYILVITDNAGCEGRDSVTIDAGETYTPSITQNSNGTCVNMNMFDFSDGNAGPSSGAVGYVWDFDGATLSTSTSASPSGVIFNVAGVNEVSVAITSGFGCVFYDTVDVTINDTAALSLSWSDVSCFGAADGSVTATAVGGVSPYSYAFNSGTPTTNNSLTGLGASSVTCYVVDANNCQSQVQAVAITEPAQITYTLNVQNTTCGLSNGSATFSTVSGGVGGYTYSSDGVNFGTSTTITGLSAGSYTFYVQDDNLCLIPQTANISNTGNAVPTPTINPSGGIDVCLDGSGSYGTLTAQSNNTSAGTFSWFVETNLSSPVSNGATLSIDDNIAASTFVYLSEFDGTCSSDLDSIQLFVLVNDVVDNSQQVFCLGDEVTLNITTSGEFTWVSGTDEIMDTMTTATSAVPQTIPAIYKYEVQIGSCLFLDSVVINGDPNCEDITIVNNAFSPDGDGINDLFIIDAAALLSNENKVLIVNRWGDLIREFHNYNNTDVAWDGTSDSGEPMPSGTYFYIVEIPSLDYRANGWIQVIR